jgi:predicted phage baseplate assembly protein
VEFLPPGDFAKHQEFGLERFWIRAMWKSGDYSSPPRLQRLLLNTTMAAQTVTIKNEILGSSDQSEVQKFQTTRKPVLAGQQLEVKESEMPPAEEQTTIESEEGDDAITVISDAAGRPEEIWVRWHEVTDFYGSGARGRHYLVDHQTGEITFGDGMNGMIPPRGNGNLRMKLYQTGGGAAGNRPADSIIQLKTTVPYVEKVINTEAAAGGADAETTESLYERAPRSVRHGGRSVTIEDYEDLALLASPEVARALCVPLRNLADDPLGNTVCPGETSVIIVPRSEDDKPLPSLELISRVREYLVDNSVPTANVSVVGPEYVRVDVTAEIALVSLEGASAVEQAVREKLAEFLHPLTGGADGKGWDFGREPYKSDFYALLHGISGVDYVRSLDVPVDAGDADIKETGRFLVYSGNHTISLIFDGTDTES